jgi:transcriptional regulator with XRE-family HTH domain
MSSGAVNIKEERLRRGLSQEKLAEAITQSSGREITADVIRGAEEGRRPQPANAVAIAAYFNVDVLVQWPLEAVA